MADPAVQKIKVTKWFLVETSEVHELNIPGK
jgi:hypothetical protein